MTTPESFPETDAMRYVRVIDEKFTAGIIGPSIWEDDEEEVAITPPFELSHCPTASIAFLSRPKAGHTGSREYMRGPIVTVYEANGLIQTDFHIHDNEIYKRQIIHYPGHYHPLQGEPEAERLERRRWEVMAEAMKLAKLDDAQREELDKKSNVGEPLDFAESSELLKWLEAATTTQVAGIDDRFED